jgi:hypothetical protein
MPTQPQLPRPPQLISGQRREWWTSAVLELKTPMRYHLTSRTQAYGTRVS